MVEMTKYYSCEDIAACLGVKKLTVWDWIRKGKLKAKKIGKMYRISQEQLDDTFKCKVTFLIN